jgi:hypothetical protein
MHWTTAKDVLGSYRATHSHVELWNQELGENSRPTSHELELQEALRCQRAASPRKNLWQRLRVFLRRLPAQAIARNGGAATRREPQKTAVAAQQTAPSLTPEMADLVIGETTDPRLGSLIGATDEAPDWESAYKAAASKALL